MTTETTEQRWFKFAVFGISGFMAGVSLANIIYYNRARSESCDAITKGQARSMWIINILIFIVSFALFIWSAVKIFFTQQAREKASSFVAEKVTRAKDRSKEFLRSGEGGVVGVTQEGRPKLNLFSRSSHQPTGNVIEGASHRVTNVRRT